MCVRDVFGDALFKASWLAFFKASWKLGRLDPLESTDRLCRGDDKQRRSNRNFVRYVDHCEVDAL